MKRIGIICGRKSSDAALCQNLEKLFSDIKIVQYQIPFNSWIPWICHRIAKAGLVTLFGHVLLSTYLRLQRFSEKTRGKSIWLDYTSSIPGWNKVKSKKNFCMSEEKLVKMLRGVDLVILLDAFRISHRVFRKLRVPFLEVIWGSAPEYMGDSGGFWAYAIRDSQKIGVSITEKKPHGNDISVIARLPVKYTQKENIRTIKIKQVLTLQKRLGEIIQQYMKKNPLKSEIKHCKCNFFYAPTIFTYFQFLKKNRLSFLPKYSHFQRICTIVTKKN